MSIPASGEPEAAAPEDQPLADRKPWRDPVCVEHRPERAEASGAVTSDGIVDS